MTSYPKKIKSGPADTYDEDDNMVCELTPDSPKDVVENQLSAANARIERIEESAQVENNKRSELEELRTLLEHNPAIARILELIEKTKRY